MIPFSIIVALDEKNGIGKSGDLPWHLPADLKYFKEITTRAPEGQKNVVIMGRKTWDSIPEKFRPLPGRINIVITRKEHLSFPQGVYKARGLEQALDIADDATPDTIGSVFVIGGAQIFEIALNHPACHELYLTQIHKSFDCDTYFPAIPERFHLSEEGERMVHEDYTFHFNRMELSSRD